MIFNYTSFLADHIRLLSRITLLRSWNYFLILSSFLLSRFTRKVHVWGYPFSLSLETSSKCNLSCPECMAGIKQTHRDKKLMDITLIANKLEIHQKNAFYCNLYAQGEPFLHQELIRIIDITNQNNYYSVISTNGHFLTEENCAGIIESGLDRLIISLDGIDAESYIKYRKGGNYNRVVDGIKRLSALKKKRAKSSPLIVVQFLVHKGNEHQVKMAPAMIKSMGADILKFKTIQVYSDNGVENFLPMDNKYNRYHKHNKKTTTAKDNLCYRIWSQAVYNSDGIMIPCCFDKIPEFPIGMDEKKRSDLWKSPPMQKFRNQVLSSSRQASICKNCIIS